MIMEWKEIKTNKQLAIENLSEIVKMMKYKVINSEKHGINESGVNYLKHYSEMIESEIERYNFKLWFFFIIHTKIFQNIFKTM